MRRLYVPDIPEGAPTLSLPEGEAHHARAVLRAREGDRFEILNGRGRRLGARVQSVSRRAVTLEIESDLLDSKPEIELVLCQALVKGKAMDLIVEKATELGATRILPVQCERSVSVGAKRERWRDLAVSAMKQCGRSWLPEIHAASSLEEVLEQTSHCEQKLVAALSGERRNLWDCLQGMEADARSLALWIGPEGDFTAGELETLCAAGFVSVSLGDNVLRAETAALVGLARIQYELERP